MNTAGETRMVKFTTGEDFSRVAGLGWAGLRDEGIPRDVSRDRMVQYQEVAGRKVRSANGRRYIGIACIKGKSRGCGRGGARYGGAAGWDVQLVFYTRTAASNGINKQSRWKTATRQARDESSLRYTHMCRAASISILCAPLSRHANKHGACPDRLSQLHRADLHDVPDSKCPETKRLF